MPLRPIRCWRKITGEPEVKRIARADSPMSGANKVSPNNAITISIGRGIPTLDPDADMTWSETERVTGKLI